jgi:hypothetical protein
MTMDVEPSRGETIRLMGRHSKWATLSSVRTNLILLAIVLLIGFATWGRLSGSSDADSLRGTAPSAVMVAQNASSTEPVNTPTRATLLAPAEAAGPAQAAPVDGLKDFIAILAEGRAGVERPGDVYAPQRQQLRGQGYRNLLRLCPQGRKPFDRPDAHDS